MSQTDGARCTRGAHRVRNGPSIAVDGRAIPFRLGRLNPCRGAGFGSTGERGTQDSNLESPVLETGAPDAALRLARAENGRCDAGAVQRKERKQFANNRTGNINERTHMEPITATNLPSGDYGQYRKKVLSRISDFTVPPGTPFETPEGLKAEDEECRIAFDSQGGVYPIRESVFQETYEAA